MATVASTNLNRILRVTANLLFEKQEDPSDVAKLLQGFVTNVMVYSWYQKYCQVNGIDRDTNVRKYKRRLPMPPIDWKAIEVKKLDEMLEQAEDEPNW